MNMIKTLTAILRTIQYNKQYQRIYLNLQDSSENSTTTLSSEMHEN